MRGVRVKKYVSGLVAIVMGLASFGGLPVSSASATSKSATGCVANSGPMDTTCTTVSNPAFHSKRIDTTPIANQSEVAVKTSCAWSGPVSVKLTVGVKLSANVEESIVRLGKTAAKAELSKSLTMTAATAGSITGPITLKPGQKVFCHRTFSYYSFTVSIKHTLYGHSTTTKTTAKVPFTLGALFSSK